MVILAGFGNPLLDLTVKIGCKQFLQKYNLKEDDQCEIDEAIMTLLLKDIKNLPIEYTPGGSVQNTLRIFQWLCQKSETAYMFGGIGNDENGAILKQLVESAGVKTMYIRSNKQTGITVAITNQENRSLVASIGAAGDLNTTLFKELIDDKLLSDVDIFYMEGFFIPNRETYARHIIEFSKLNNKLFVLNISAPYICKDKNHPINYFVENCDIMVGNMKEYEALSQMMNFNGTLLNFAIYLSNTNINENWQYAKMVIITNGSKNAMCIHNKGQITKIDVPQVSVHDIKDTTGAGDSFVAGFLFGLLKNCSPEICLRYGCWAAQQIIMQVGCQIPNYLPEIKL